MTTVESGLNVQLLQDLRQKYPEVAEHVITSCVRQNKNDRQKCIEALDKETPNALFGNDPNLSRIQDMHIQVIEQRPRSDSASSGISSASTSSSSSYKKPTDFWPMESSYTSDLSQYVKNSGSDIPNIECRVSSTSPQTKSNIISSGLRQIPVQHIQTLRSPQENPSGSSHNPIIYSVMYPMDNRLPQGTHPMGHPNYMNHHQSGTFNYSLQRSPITSHSNHGPPPASRSFSVQPPGLDPQSSHITNIIRMSPGDRTPVYSPGNYNHCLHSSQSEPFLIGLTDDGAAPSNNKLFTPLVVNVGQPQYQHHEIAPSHSANDISIAGAINPPSFKTGGASQGDNGHFYTPYPNEYQVSGHPHNASRSSSSESEHSVIGNPNGERRHVSTINFTPKVVPSPSSSHSSLSSDSSHHQAPDVAPRRQSGNIQEEAEYTQALISFQNDRMSKLKSDLESELRKLAKLRTQVNQMEKNMLENRRNRNVNCFPSIEDVAKLRELNRRLQADIQVHTREIDMYNNGQLPLGVYDPAALEQQNFFKTMNPGQRGSIFAPPPPEPPTSDSPPPLPPRIHAIPPAPPVQPPSGSGDSDGDGEQWNCSACTFLNHPALNKCECCEMPRLNSSPPSTGVSSHGT